MPPLGMHVTVVPIIRMVVVTGMLVVLIVLSVVLPPAIFGIHLHKMHRATTCLVAIAVVRPVALAAIQQLASRNAIRSAACLT